jgi:hypothetical protein
MLADGRIEPPLSKWEPAPLIPVSYLIGVRVPDKEKEELTREPPPGRHPHWLDVKIEDGQVHDDFEDYDGIENARPAVGRSLFIHGLFIRDLHRFPWSPWHPRRIVTEDLPPKRTVGGEVQQQLEEFIFLNRDTEGRRVHLRNEARRDARFHHVTDVQFNEAYRAVYITKSGRPPGGKWRLTPKYRQHERETP